MDGISGATGQKNHRNTQKGRFEHAAMLLNPERFLKLF